MDKEGSLPSLSMHFTSLSVHFTFPHVHFASYRLNSVTQIRDFSMDAIKK